MCAEQFLVISTGCKNAEGNVHRERELGASPSRKQTGVGYKIQVKK